MDPRPADRAAIVAAAGMFDAAHAAELCEEATGFVAQMRRLLSRDQEA